MKFSSINNRLLQEALASPNLLSDLAGLELYISESYNNRSFIELLQNADDAGARKFKIIRDGDFLFVANDGRVFTEQDFESLCRSASSQKVRGKTIGYRGIGFKSVVGFAEEIFVLSGDLEIYFSRDKTKQEIPEAKQVPLIRIPHTLSEKIKNDISRVYQELQTEGYKTIFVFTGVDAIDIESEFNTLNSEALLFLRNVEYTEFILTHPVVTEIKKNIISDGITTISFSFNGNVKDWEVFSLETSSIAFSRSDGKIIKLNPEEALLHSFLPSEESTGLGVLINGDYSTDPSRRHIIFDDITTKSIEVCAEQIVSLIKDSLSGRINNGVDIVNALIPFSDPRMAQFSKNSFSKVLLEEIKNTYAKVFEDLKLCPEWLNPKDFDILTKRQKNTIDNSYSELNGFNSFMKYLGVKELPFEEISVLVNKEEISLLGCAQLSKYIINSIISFKAINESDVQKLKVFYSEGKRVSLNDLKKKPQVLDDSFSSLLYENGITESDLKSIYKRFIPGIKLDSLLRKRKNETIYENESYSTDDQDLTPIKSWFDQSKRTMNETIQGSVKRWRNAEEQTLAILNMNGFRLVDVSKQNIGYDLEGIDPDGNEIQIEVKSINLPGQKFRLTNNEVAVAQEKQGSFFIAVVRQNTNVFEIALIPDPVNTLILNRQCVQWIWECEEYEYKPMRFEI